MKSQLDKNSSNSSKPPSSDSPYKKSRYPNNKQSDKKGKAGAKVGHKGQRLKLMEPTNIIPIHPEECYCGCKAIINQKPFYTHQTIELPEIKMDVTHYVLHKGECVECDKIVKATIPQSHQTGYGPRLSAFIGEELTWVINLVLKHYFILSLLSGA